LELVKNFQSFREYRVGLRGQLKLLARPEGAEPLSACVGATFGRFISRGVEA
jgi:hypothetical protein